MYYRLTGALKRRVIDDLRKYWQYHPEYPDLAGHIQGKYSFKERPSYGIIVKTSSGSQVMFSADNYMGVVESYVYTAKVKNYAGLALEWVREDAIAIQNNGGRFPSPPGVYFIELTERDQFYVDPLYDVYGETLTMTSQTQGFTKKPFVEGTLRLFEMPQSYQMYEGTNYTLVRDGAGKPTGEINLVNPLTGGRYLKADYRWPGESSGPHPLIQDQANNTAIPGCVLAFGRRNIQGDRLAVVVQDIRRPAALEYGGAWDISLDIDVIARDVDAQQEIADQTAILLGGVLKPLWSSMGIEMTDLALGGESEEVYDENGDDYFYNSSMSMTLSTQWSLHIPLDIFIRAASPLTLAESKALSSLSDEEIAKKQNNIREMESLGLTTMVDPFFSGAKATFEGID